MLRVPTFPAGEARTGCALAGGAAVLAQSALLSRGFVGGVLPLLFHAAAAALAYLLFLNLSKRKLGAPLIAAVLFAAHPAVLPALADDGREAAGAAAGLFSAILLARTPLDPRLLWPALGAYAVALPLAPATASLPFLVAAGVVAYHGLEPKRLFTKRLLPRFAAFLVPLAAWATWSGRHGAGRGFASAAADALAIAAPTSSRVDASTFAGAALVVLLGAYGLLRLRAAPKSAWPCLALALTFVATALLPDAAGGAASAYVTTAFAALLAAEGIEELFYRFGGVFAAPLLVLAYAALATLSHLAAG